MATAIRAGVIYALIVLLIDFMFGTVRVLLLAPGETLAVSLEAPVMLIASWFVSRWCLVASAVRGFRARVEMLEPDSAAAGCHQEHAPG
jgi:hypothetical protein